MTELENVYWICGGSAGGKSDWQEAPDIVGRFARPGAQRAR